MAYQSPYTACFRQMYYCPTKNLLYPIPPEHETNLENNAFYILDTILNHLLLKLENLTHIKWLNVKNMFKSQEINIGPFQTSLR